MLHCQCGRACSILRLHAGGINDASELSESTSHDSPSAGSLELRTYEQAGPAPPATSRLAFKHPDHAPMLVAKIKPKLGNAARQKFVIEESDTGVGITLAAIQHVQLCHVAMLMSCMRQHELKRPVYLCDLC